MTAVRIICGDVLDELDFIPSNSVDSIVTDPPYELGFMGKGWDKSGIANSVEMWREALRVLKPGGHLLAFSGTRTYHRMVVAIEDAGFEVRDQIGWLYGSGFPKSLDVSKAIDKAAGAERECTRPGVVQRDGYGDDWDTGSSSSRPRFDDPATDAARQWQGWGTALKPAWEPICVARKPLIGTVAANVLAHGTGALNIDGCRVGDELVEKGRAGRGECESNALGKRLMGTEVQQWQTGRWPANIIHDGSDEVLAAFPVTTSGSGNKNVRNRDKRNAYGNGLGAGYGNGIGGDTGSAARFFYAAKASKKDRNSGLDGYDLVIIEPVANAKGEKWESEDHQVRLLVDTGASPPRVTAAFGAHCRSVSEWNTLLFGNWRTGQCLKGSTFTTGTATSSTTGLTTLSYFQRLLTSASTQGVNSVQTDGGSPVESAANGAMSITTTSEAMASVLGAELAACATLWKTSASAWVSSHPTVKPTDLMRYLCRLVTPPGGVVLDPFMGSGSTGKAAVLEGFNFIGIDMVAEYVSIAKHRIAAVMEDQL